ncbi:hypothetical protein RG47T_5154 [Mucilaginibacter polytrichastri]|uniref:PDZ domain-containing protein n=2 Tax=Mucilaginibacter polytrichastri TaxID=1302689 RepID=A0A1Q6A6P7_9SPHI|nr:hypothetical protein RG47T_5154 [Mucilaginibacter polytrichastri]
MCAWTPGFYEIADFGGAVSNFTATDRTGKPLWWKKGTDSTWSVQANGRSDVILNYDVKADNPFIANANLDENYGYFVPGAIFMYLDDRLKLPLTVEIKPYKNWPRLVATGLDPLPGRVNTFLVKNFDVLYDSPFLMGKLEQFPASAVKGKRLAFIGYQMGHFDRKLFMDNLTKIAESGSAIIGDVPYNHYSFLGVGMPIHGFGGIEHLNSASLIMANDSAVLTQPKIKESMYAFLAHEYFHLYNVKRIRPIALGPFDYTKENYTNMLWVSEGFTDYYEYLILRRAGLMTPERVLANYQEHIQNYENSSGHLYQTLIQSSRGIWAMRGKPTERTPEEVAKTISVYDKGCVMGMMLDLKIRHETQNKKSLDDVMRALYKKYYQLKNRGFTDLEFQQECEIVAGSPLKELFSYSTTVAVVNYPKYLSYAGLSIDTVTKALPSLTMGAEVGYHSADTSWVVRSITWPSSAFNAGIKARDKIIEVNGMRASQSYFKSLMTDKRPGDQLQLKVLRDKKINIVSVILSTKYEKSFSITPIDHPDALQIAIYNNWLR